MNIHAIQRQRIVQYYAQFALNLCFTLIAKSRRCVLIRRSLLINFLLIIMIIVKR